MIPHFIVCTERGTNAFTSMHYYLHTYSRLKTPFKGNVFFPTLIESENNVKD